MNRKKTKAAAILIAAMAITTTTAWADSATAPDPSAGASTAAVQQQASLGSVSDGKFTLTLEEVQATQSKVDFTYSIEMLTKEAQDELNATPFGDSTSVKMPEGARFNVRGQSEIEELRTDTKRYYTSSMDGFDNPTGQPVSFVLDIMKDETKAIVIPTDPNIETRELTLGTVPGDGTVVRISAQGIFVEKNVPEGFDDMIRFMDMYFRMADDSVKTFNQLFEHSSCSYAWSDINLDLPLRYKYSANAVSTVDLAKIKSIIVGNLEYDFNDTSQVKEVQLEGDFAPVTLQPAIQNGSPMVPVREAIEKLGGEVTYNPVDQSTVIQYRGDTVVLRAGNTSYQKNGETAAIDDYMSAASISDDGRLVLNPFAFTRCFGVDAQTVYIWPDVDEREDGVSYQGEVDYMYLIP